MRRVLGVLLSPRLLPLHTLGVAATVVAVLLGVWQLQAWQAQRAAETRDLSSLPPVAVETVLGPDDPFPSAAVGRPVELSGTWLPQSSFLVADRTHEGRDGFWAVTPLAVCDAAAGDSACADAPALLVVRGWTASPAQAPASPEGRADLTGWLQPPEGSGQRDPDPTDDVLPEVRIADALQRVDQDLYGAYLIAEQADPATGLAGLQPVTPDSLPEPPTGTGLRNLLYAVEWWVFGLFALFIWWRWSRDEVERGRRGPQEPDGPAPARIDQDA